MRIDIITIFPSMFDSPFEEGIIKRAREKGLLSLNVFDLRDFTTDKHRKVDDVAYGGGGGMVLRVEPIFMALKHLALFEPPLKRVILLSPQGERFTQEKAKELAQEERLVFICGRYEGVDERVRLGLATDELSIGDYVLSGGELACMVVMDAVARLIPGVVGKQECVRRDSFYSGLLDFPHYTRPKLFMGMEVPAILLSGNHEKIERWRRREALKKTMKRRPDLLGRDSSLQKEHCHGFNKNS